MKNVGVLLLSNMREALRDRLLFGLLLTGAIVLLLLVFLAPMTLGARDKTFHDFGLAWIYLSGFLILVIMGAWSIHRERDRSIWLTVLTRPVARFEYLLGRYLGLQFLLLLTIVSAAIMYALIAMLAGIHPVNGLVHALLYIFMEMSILAGFVLFFSTLSGFAMTIFLALAVFFAGHLAGDLIRLTAMSENFVFEKIAYVCHWILPHLELFRVRDDLVGGIIPSLSEIGHAVVYTALYLAALLLLSFAVFNRKELQ